MAFAACVFYTARAGCADAVEKTLATLREHTLGEPGCLAYEPHRDRADDTRFFLYECYVDEAAYTDHQSTDYFMRYAREGLADHLIDRRVERYEPLAERPLQR
ncbi:MAG TPA: putative quinol monooxygenase [Solirubrobacteraceae bacterium]|jgi:quinol monooxygenase YgiN|nr:putative quinol monooxygenase [Solirubrobacteraceae bacterium]